MGQRGPASQVEQKLTAHERRVLDAAIVTEPSLFDVFTGFELEAKGISQSSFYRYAGPTRYTARMQHIGELVRQLSGAVEEVDEAALVKVSRLRATERLLECLEDETLAPTKVASIAAAIEGMTRAMVAVRKSKAEKAADEIGKKLEGKTDAETLQWIRENVAGLA